MKTTEDKITFGQFATVAAISVFSPVSRLLPKASLEIGGRGCWVAPLIAFGPVVLLSAAARRVTKVGKNGLEGALESILGKLAGKIFALIIGAWIVFYGGFVLRSGAERMLSTVYETGKLKFFLISMAAVAIIPALGRVSSLSRTAELCMIFLTLTLAIIFIFAAPDIKAHYLLPVNVLDAGKLAASALPVINVSTTWVLLAFLGGHIRENSFKKSTMLKWISFMLLIELMVFVTTVGVLGPELSKSQQFPFFVMISNINVLNILERIEPVIVMIWVLTDFVFASALMMSSAEAFRGALGLRKRKLTALLSGAGMLIVSVVITDNAFDFAKLSEHIIPLVNLAFTVGFMPLLLLFAKK